MTRHQLPAEDWHALDIDTVECQLKTSPAGLTAEESASRLTAYGYNRIAEEPPPGALVLLLHQFQSPLIYILLGAAVVTFLLEEYIDASIIAVVLALNAVIGFTQEHQAESSVRALKRMLSPRAHVVRDGRDVEIDSQELVPGDVVLLESGARVPADLRLVSVTALRVNESMLTGESLPSGKRPDTLAPETPIADRENMVFAGTVVTSGRGRGYVVATGDATELGAIARQVREDVEIDTPLQQRLRRFSALIGLVVGAAALVALAIGLARGESASQMFTVVVAMAVSAIPEGLPVAFTITLAIGVRRMARRNAIIRHLPAVETLGSTTVIGSDKTGTLTENRMTVQRLWTDNQFVDLPAAPSHPVLAASDNSAIDRSPLRALLLCSVIPNEAHVYSSADGLTIQGDPTDAALLMVATTLGVDPEAARAAHPVAVEVPFESELRYAASICEVDARPCALVKGAPEQLLRMSSQLLTSAGVVPLDHEAVHAAAQVLASEGLRVLAMAYRELPDSSVAEVDSWQPDELVFAGLMGMMDPPRAGVLEAIRNCQGSGIRVVMITGDHAETARVIASRLGIAKPDAPVLTGADLDRRDDTTLRRELDSVSVFARVAPEHKHRIVRAFQDRDEVVAVTGDGVNDAPALKAADIGVAMGRGGTDVAREAADMVLADDNFVSVYAAVEEGRVTFDNLRKVTFFLLSTGAAEVLVILAALSLGWPLPFVAAQILWLNLVTNGLQDVALAFEPAEPDVAARPPRPRDAGLLSTILWERLLFTGGIMAVGTLALLRWEYDRTGSLMSAQTVALTTMVVFQAFHVGNSRSEGRSLFRIHPLSNPLLFIATAAALGVHIAALYLPPTQYMLRVEPIGIDAWIRVIAVASTIVVGVELHKRLRSRDSQPPGELPEDRAPRQRNSSAA